MKRVSFFFLLPLLLISHPLFGDQLHQWKLDETYHGRFPNAFQKLRYEVPILIRQSLIDISVRTGLNFQEGWSSPMTIRFVDSAPWGAENVLAYVQLYSTTDGFAQELCVNLAAYEKEAFNFPNVFSHELTHAMLNDRLGGGAAQKIPTWFHEGLAVYAANQGETMIRSYVYKTGSNSDEILINGLEGPHGAYDYAEDYLAFKYIYEHYNSNALRLFIQEVIKREGDISAALEYICLVKWDDFTQDLLAYSRQQIQEIGIIRKGDYEKPY